MRLFDDDNVPVYLDAIDHRVEKTKDGDEIKAVDLTLRVQPFTPELAVSLDPDIRAFLFSMGAGEPKDKIKAVHFNLTIPRQTITVRALPESDAGGLVLSDVEITGLRARTEKGVDGYALIFYASFGPPSTGELEYVVAWHTTQRSCTFAPQQPALDFAGKTEGPREVAHA